MTAGTWAIGISVAAVMALIMGLVIGCIEALVLRRVSEGAGFWALMVGAAWSAGLVLLMVFFVAADALMPGASACHAGGARRGGQACAGRPDRTDHAACAEEPQAASPAGPEAAGCRIALRAAGPLCRRNWRKHPAAAAGLPLPECGALEGDADAAFGRGQRAFVRHHGALRGYERTHAFVDANIKADAGVQAARDIIAWSGE